MLDKGRLFHWVSTACIGFISLTASANVDYVQDNVDAVINDIKFLGEGCSEGTAVDYDEATGNTIINFSQLSAKIGPEKLQDRAICIIKYTISVPISKQAIIPAAIFKGYIHSGEASQHMVNIRYRNAGSIGPASIWDFSGLADGKFSLVKPLTDVSANCGETINMKLSVIANAEFIDRNSLPNTSHSTRINSVVLPKINLKECES